MIYKDFDSYKINENIMNTTDFGKIELDNDEDCEFSIFEHYPKHTFIIELKSGKCHSYGNKSKRVKYWDTDDVNTKLNLDIKTKSIISTPNGQYIKDQYEELSGLDVSNIYQYK